MGVEDSFNAMQAVAGERRDLWHRGVGERQPHHGGAAQVMKRQAMNVGLGAGLRPRCPKAVGRLRLPAGRRQDHGASPVCPGQHGT